MLIAKYFVVKKMDKITIANQTFNSVEKLQINEIKETSIWILLVYFNWFIFSLNDNKIFHNIRGS